MENGRKDLSESSAGKSAQEMGLSDVPDCYIIPPQHRPNLDSDIADVPIIDLVGLNQSPHQRFCVIQEIGKACLQMGFFQIVNHGICQSVLEEALTTASDFFHLPASETNKFMSNDIQKPVRYGISLKDGIDSIQFRRLFLKHYAHPLDKWAGSWPSKPSHYRHDMNKMGRCCMEVRKVAMQVMGAITESLGLGPTYLSEKLEAGMQVMAVNCYPPCPQPDIGLGLPAHSDYICITIHLQSCPGLQLLDPDDGTWKLVPELKGVLQVHIGDHFEVLSNGLYKSVAHRVILNSQRNRFSLASLHSLAMDEKMECAEELIHEERPRAYKGSSFRDFLSPKGKASLRLLRSKSSIINLASVLCCGP